MALSVSTKDRRRAFTSFAAFTDQFRSAVLAVAQELVANRSIRVRCPQVSPESGSGASGASNSSEIETSNKSVFQSALLIVLGSCGATILLARPCDKSISGAADLTVSAEHLSQFLPLVAAESEYQNLEFLNQVALAPSKVLSNSLLNYATISGSTINASTDDTDHSVSTANDKETVKLQPPPPPRQLAEYQISRRRFSEALVALYEDVLSYELDWQAGKLSLIESNKRKKRAGNFYTGNALARLSAAQALEPLTTQASQFDDLLQLRVVDPAMGGASFLLATVDYLLERSRDISHAARNCRDQLIGSCIHGVDIDYLAVVLCRIVMLIESNLAGQDLISLAQKLNLSLRFGDSIYLDWRKEFPAVFARFPAGFDAVIGNPPWEIHKPNSREFFQRFDKNFWQYGKQKALARQRELTKNPLIGEEWKQYKRSYEQLRQKLKSKQFRYQGNADLNAYKLFLELGQAIARDSGLLSFIVPSGIYCDLGARELRRLFLEHNTWRTIVGFENRQAMFDIHRSFKFCLIAVQKGGETHNISCSFMSSSAESSSCEAIDYPRASISKFSPNSMSFIELETKKDLQILQKLYDNGCLLGQASDWNLKFEREFDMTNDSHLFVPINDLHAAGYRADVYGHWLCGDWRQAGETKPSTPTLASADGKHWLAIEQVEDIALPLYEGRMVNQFDFSEKGWVSGKGRQAVWNVLIGEKKEIAPQYLMLARHYPQWHTDANLLKCGFLSVGSATNSRSMIASALSNLPCGNSVPVLTCTTNQRVLQLVACLNSFVFDFALRCRLAGNNLNYFVIGECPLPDWSKIQAQDLVLTLSSRLNLNGRNFAPLWLQLEKTEIPVFWPTDEHDRRECRSALDAIVAKLYGLNCDDLSWILRGCFNETTDRPIKGFWRKERHLPVSRRHTALTLNHLAEIESIGLHTFCERLSERLSSEPLLGREVSRTKLSKDAGLISLLQARAATLASIRLPIRTQAPATHTRL